MWAGSHQELACLSAQCGGGGTSAEENTNSPGIMSQGFREAGGIRASLPGPCARACPRVCSGRWAEPVPAAE